MRAEGERVGAMVYARLMDHRLSHPLEETHELVHGFFEQPREALLLALEEQLRQAYVAGVSDGFAQGVAVTPQPPLARDPEWKQQTGC